MVHGPSLRKAPGPVLSLQDGESLLATGLSTQRPKSSVSFAPRLSTISGYR
jgi:Flp pilus assembly secretin CpaC